MPSILGRFLFSVFLLLRYWPLWSLRLGGQVLGTVLFLVAGSRRRVALINLQLCFPSWSPWQRGRCARQSFVYFVQAWLDRPWLWHASPAVLAKRLHCTGHWDALKGSDPTVLFMPHFYGLDAAGVAAMHWANRQYCTIYTPQRNRLVDEWTQQGRSRFGNLQLFNRLDGVKPIAQNLRQGGVLILLPDMNFGPEESIFVPFFGVQAATVPSLSRFAKLGRAKVIPIVARIHAKGYLVDVMPEWQDFPTDDAAADTARMNTQLEQWISTMPAQYYWVHKRFKTAPVGQVPPY